MKRVIPGLLALTLVIGLASPGWAAGLTLTIREGRVSLDAQDVTIRQILAEWARVGKTRIVNLERASSAPMTLKFDGLPEDEALEIILRALPGYFAARRAVPVADASMYDRIALMTTTTQVAAAPPPPRPSQVTYSDPSANVTQLRAAQPPLVTPGLLPEQPDDQRNDPAIAAAAAAGLTAVPAPAMGGVSQPQGPLLPPVRNAGAPASTPSLPQAATPSNPWSVPQGTPLPGLAPPPPPPSTNPPPNRLIGGTRPQPADQ
jgi:hypothetical protein